MKISDLIRKLESLKEKHGDNELRFTVRDFYSKYSEEMTTRLKTGESGPFDWEDVATNGNRTTIHFRLSENMEGKKPKIIFRK